MRSFHATLGLQRCLWLSLSLAASACAAAAGSAPAGEPSQPQPGGGAVLASSGGCIKDQECGQGLMCREQLCVPQPGSAKPAEWLAEACWIAAETRIVEAPNLHGAECLTTSQLAPRCKKDDAGSCYGLGRLTETAPGGELAQAMPYYKRACELGLQVACGKKMPAK